MTTDDYLFGDAPEIVKKIAKGLEIKCRNISTKTVSVADKTYGIHVFDNEKYEAFARDLVSEGFSRDDDNIVKEYFRSRDSYRVFSTPDMFKVGMLMGYVGKELANTEAAKN
jgi:hypothetical protein